MCIFTSFITTFTSEVVNEFYPPMLHSPLSLNIEVRTSIYFYLFKCISSLDDYYNLNAIIFISLFHRLYLNVQALLR